MHEPRHLAQMAEDLTLLDVDESDDDSFCDEAIRRYLGEDEARRDTPNRHRPSVPRVRMIIFNKFKFALLYFAKFPTSKICKNKPRKRDWDKLTFMPVHKQTEPRFILSVEMEDSNCNCWFIDNYLCTKSTFVHYISKL